MSFLGNFFGGSPQVQPDLADAIARGALLVDVRNQGEFTSGSVDGAINIPVEVIGEHTDKLKDHDMIIVFCRSGNRSAYAQQILQSKGIKNVINGGTWQHVAQIKKQIQ